MTNGVHPNCYKLEPYIIRSIEIKYSGCKGAEEGRAILTGRPAGAWRITSTPLSCCPVLVRRRHLSLLYTTLSLSPSLPHEHVYIYQSCYRPHYKFPGVSYSSTNPLSKSHRELRFIVLVYTVYFKKAPFLFLI